MPMKKCIVKCDTPSEILFTIPTKDDVFNLWKIACGENVKLTKGMYICANHFATDDIIRKRLLTSGEIVVGVSEYKKPRLRPGAVPTVFEKTDQLPKAIKNCSSNNLNITETTGKKQLFTYARLTPFKASIINEKDDLENMLLATPLTHKLFDLICNETTVINIPRGWNKCIYTGNPDFVIFFQLVAKISPTVINNEILPFFGKTVIFDSNCNVQCKYLGKSIPIELIYRDNLNGKPEMTVESLECLISKFDKKYVCKGVDVKNQNVEFKTQVTYIDSLNKWRHNNCCIILQEQNIVCASCKLINRTFNNNKVRRKSKTFKRISLKVTPSKKHNLKLLRKRNHLKQQHNRKLKHKIANIKLTIEDYKEKIKNLDEETVLKKIPSGKHQLLVQEILTISKRKNSHGNRYSEDWVILCLLLHIKSPSAYSFLRVNKIMPLPCIRTIRNYLSTINTSCGFDESFFELFKKKIESKNSMQKHGLLVFDEISVRESISVKSHTLTYSGLIDFGKEDEVCNQLPKPNSLDDLANHGLVFLFQPLADTYTQPIAVFASRGPVKGDTLVKLLIKATILLEKAGVLIHGFVSDSALTNRKVWSELGISGKLESSRSYIEHFNDSNRKFFAFSDTSHLIKNVRNRLYNKRELLVDPMEKPVKWNHFRILHEYDKTISNSKLHLCPKITENHLNLRNSSLKMRVRLAVQVLSNSMAVGLEVLKKRKVQGLENCDSTINFCLKFNEMFDALNRKVPFQGVHPDTNDYKVLQDTLKWLNDWEMRVKIGELNEQHFLTSNTAEGLRVTLNSTIDIILYLIEEYNFSYVLTGKITQDKLEIFFGTIRQAAGANDHPGTPTFLQLYKLLSIYNLLKPPKFGNCTVEPSDDAKPLITISEIKLIFNNKNNNPSALDEIKKKMDGLVDDGDWEFSDVFEHDYSLSPIKECLIYYLVGYLSKQISTRAKCDICISAFKSMKSFSNVSEAELTNFKSMGKLIHPNYVFYKFICKVEDYFTKNINSADVYSETIEDILQNEDLNFPCNVHKDDILAYSIRYYINMRMRQFTRQLNKEKLKENSKKKKVSKFCRT